MPADRVLDAALACARMLVADVSSFASVHDAQGRLEQMVTEDDHREGIAARTQHRSARWRDR